MCSRRQEKAAELPSAAFFVCLSACYMSSSLQMMRTITPATILSKKFMMIDTCSPPPWRQADKISIQQIIANVNWYLTNVKKSAIIRYKHQTLVWFLFPLIHIYIYYQNSLSPPCWGVDWNSCNPASSRIFLLSKSLLSFTESAKAQN